MKATATLPAQRHWSRVTAGVTLFFVVPAAAWGAWRWTQRPRPTAAAERQPAWPVEPAAASSAAASASPSGDPPPATPDSGGARALRPTEPAAAAFDALLRGDRGALPAVPGPTGSQRIFSWGVPGSLYDIDVYALDGVLAQDSAKAHRKLLETAGFHVKTQETTASRVTMTATHGSMRVTVVTVGDQQGNSTTSVITAGSAGGETPRPAAGGTDR